jgi:hypothetical protein
MDAEGLLALPTAAQRQFQTAVGENQKLRRYINGQSVIIEAIECELPDGDSISDQIDAIKSELSSVIEHIRSATLFLAQLLRAQSPIRSTQSAGRVLEAALRSAQQMLLECSKEAIANGHGSVPLTKIIEIEDHIDQLIQEMEHNKMYPEAEEEQAERNRVMEEHNEKVVDYLDEMQKALNQQAFA